MKTPCLIECILLMLRVGCDNFKKTTIYSVESIQPNQTHGVEHHEPATTTLKKHKSYE